MRKMYSVLINVIILQQLHSLKVPVPLHKEEVVDEVLGRLPKWVRQEFNSITISKSTGELKEGKAIVRGTPEGVSIQAASPVDALYAAHAYLREFCGTMISWDERNVREDQGNCKRPDAFVRTYASNMIRYFGNICTFSYSFPWWTWAEWERFIDWLALSGFNMALSPVGQERVWKALWMELGVSPEGVDEFFTGPAYLAWHRMGNVKNLGGIMSQAYLDSQLELNKKIVSRMNRIGIVPVLPTFAGFVPDEFVRNNPNLQFHKNACWGHFNNSYTCVYSLDPRETNTYESIAHNFIEKQRELYGAEATHVYAGDPYNEIPPQHQNLSDIAETAKVISSGCKKGDDKCVWVLQAWQFLDWKEEAVRAFLSAVSIGDLLVLDLYAEYNPMHKVFKQFYGHYFVWCLLHNFGGNSQLRGNLGEIGSDYDTARKEAANLMGSGLTMEGIYQNYVVYQYFIDKTWTPGRLDPFDWIPGYVSARYGVASPLALKAWSILTATFYSQPHKYTDALRAEQKIDGQDIRRPIFLYFRPAFNGKIQYWFATAHIENMARYFTLLNRVYGQNPLFRQDYSDIMREHLQYLIGNKAILRIYEGYGMGDMNVVRSGCSRMEQHFEELDLVANTALSNWINAARSVASTADEAERFEQIATNQLTLWGPRGEVLDYARKEWSGLIRKYYAKRWSFFCDYILSHPGVHFNQKKFEEELFKQVEKPFAGM